MTVPCGVAAAERRTAERRVQRMMGRSAARETGLAMPDLQCPLLQIAATVQWVQDVHQD